MRFLLDKPYRITGKYLQTTPPWTPSAPHLGLDIVSNNHKLYDPVDGAKVVLGKDVRNGNFVVYFFKLAGQDWKLTASHLASYKSTSPKSKAGMLRGYQGKSGLASGIHTHFHVRRNGIQVNPDVLFKLLDVKEVDVYKGKDAKAWYELARKRGDNLRELIKMYKQVSSRKFTGADDWKNIKGVNISLVDGYKELIDSRSKFEKFKNKVINFIKVSK